MNKIEIINKNEIEIRNEISFDVIFDMIENKLKFIKNGDKEIYINLWVKFICRIISIEKNEDIINLIKNFKDEEDDI